ncbi:MAG: hypothetical protein DGJ47_000162 [Rickettsiaceae bacterium]
MIRLNWQDIKQEEKEDLKQKFVELLVSFEETNQQLQEIKQDLAAHGESIKRTRNSVKYPKDIFKHLKQQELAVNTTREETNLSGSLPEGESAGEI